MRRWTICWMLLVSLVALAESPSEREARLRAMTRLPVGNANFCVGMSADGHFSFQSSEKDNSKKAVKLADALSNVDGSIESFKKYPTVFSASELSEKPDLHRQLIAKAERLGVEYVRQYPDDLDARLLLAFCHHALNKFDLAESQLKAATQAKPREPEYWRILGTHYIGRAISLCVGKQIPTIDDPTGLMSLTPQQRQLIRQQMLLCTNCSGTSVNQLLMKASDAFDVSLLLSPNDIRAVGTRTRWMFAILSLLHEETNREHYFALAQLMYNNGILRENTLKSDGQRITELTNDPMGIAFGLFMYLCDFSSPGPMKFAEQFPTKEIEFFRKCEKRLIALRQSSDAKTAQQASTVLVMTQSMFLHDNVAAGKTLISSTWDVKDRVQDDLSLLVFYDNDQIDEVAKIIKSKLEKAPDAKRSFMLAKRYYTANKIIESKAVLEEAIKNNPEDFLCQSMLAALLLSKGTNDDLKQVDQLLSAVEKTFHQRMQELANGVKWETVAPHVPPQDRVESAVEGLPPEGQELLSIVRTNRIIWLALSGKTDEIYPKLKEWQAFTRPHYERMLDIQKQIQPVNQAADISPILPPDGIIPSNGQFEPMSIVSPPGKKPIMNIGMRSGNR